MSKQRDLDDFIALREAAILTLLDAEKVKTPSLETIQGAVARSEWGRIDPDRRFWALGHCAGDSIDFDEVRNIVHLGWDQLDQPVQDALRTQILDWVRPAVG